jgi:hypothetical protein
LGNFYKKIGGLKEQIKDSSSSMCARDQRWCLELFQTRTRRKTPLVKQD